MEVVLLRGRDEETHSVVRVFLELAEVGLAVGRGLVEILELEGLESASKGCCGSQ